LAREVVQDVLQEWCATKLRAAVRTYQLGDLSRACTVFEQVLQARPRHAEALKAIGMISLQLNDLEKAVQFTRRAIEVNPDDPGLHYNLGFAYQGLRQMDAALAAYERTIQHDPKHFFAWINKANVLLGQGRIQDSMAAYQRALKLDPSHVPAWIQLSITQHRLKLFDQSIFSIQKAIELEPSNAQAYLISGNHQFDRGNFEVARKFYGRAIAIDPNFADAHYNRGLTHFLQRNWQEAINNFLATLALNARIGAVPGFLCAARARACDWRDDERHLSVLKESIQRGDMPMQPLHVITALESPALLKQVAVTWIMATHPPDIALGPITRYTTRKRIHVAFVSAEFRDHPAAYNTVGVFEQFDQSRFKLTAISLHRHTDDPIHTRIRKAFEDYIEVDNKSDLEVARMMRELNVDIAVDMMGSGHNERAGIFALRCAPIQVNYYGWTSGASYIDYLIGDPIVTPLQHAGHFSEKLVQLPNAWYPTDNRRPIADNPGTRTAQNLPEQGFVFCSFNNSYKFRPQVFDVWMRILNNVPESVLWLREFNANAANNLRHEAQVRGIAPDRLIFAKHAPRTADHLARHTLADLFLDNLPFNAHTTASDALWAGLPVITCLGDTTLGRIAASLLAALDLPELIAHDMSDYERLAVELATHPKKLARLREKLARNRKQAPLFDTPAYTRDIERAFMAMVKRYISGLPPAHLQVGPKGVVHA
jgi:protein O-GlcNAc transferase